jgi:Ni/Co efflux regulator RcnB
MADLSAHRGTASAILAAAVVAVGVIAGANAIVKARGAAKPVASTPRAQATPQAAAQDAALAETPKLKLTGLRKWRPAELPKRLKLKPVVRHAHKIITRVTAVAVAVGPTAAAAPDGKSRSQHKRARPARHKSATPARRHVVRKHPKGGTHAKPPPVAGPTSPPSSPPPPAGTSPPAPPAPPAPPPPPATTPTGLVAITGRPIAGQTLSAAWAGADPAGTTYQWELCDPDGNNCQPLPAETNPTYLLKTSDIRNTIRVLAVYQSYSSTSRATDQIESGL